MVDSKAVAYELTKQVPLDVLESFRKTEDNPYDMETVAEQLMAEELPRWLYYAIEESDHSISEIPLKIPLYIPDKTIVKKAKQLSKKTSPEQTLTETDSSLWTETDSIENYSTEFEQNYTSAQSALQEVFTELFEQTESFNDTDNKALTTLSENILVELDIFGWELGRKQANKKSDTPNRLVAEWVIESLPTTELAESYLSLTQTPSNYESYESYRTQKEKLASELTTAVETSNIEQFSGQINGDGLLPKQTEFIQKLPNKQEDRTSSEIDENVKEVIDEEWDDEN
jgi:hypothetical protein